MSATVLNLLSQQNESQHYLINKAAKLYINHKFFDVKEHTKLGKTEENLTLTQADAESCNLHVALLLAV